MAESYAKRSKELIGVYETISVSRGTFGAFLKSKLTKDVLKKCNLTAVDLRYTTLNSDTVLYSFGDHWSEHDTEAHVYSARPDDAVPQSPSKTAGDALGGDETSCARMFVTASPVRILVVKRSLIVDLCRKWVQEHYEANSGGARGGDSPPPPTADDNPSAMPRNLFARREGISLTDYALYAERDSDFHSVGGVAYEETGQTSSRHVLLFGTRALVLRQEFVYPSKKKLRKADDDGFLCCNEPSRPQAPPPNMMKRGKSVNTPPVATPPPPSYQPKTPPMPVPAPRPSTPTLSEGGGGEGNKTPAKPPVISREGTLGKLPPPPPKEVIQNKDATKDEDGSTNM